LGQHIAVMRLGHIQQVGTSQDIMEHPANDFVRGFFETEQAIQPETIQRLLDQGYGTATTATPSLPGTSTINELAAVLRTPTAAVVATESGSRELSTTDLLDYLATKEVD